MHRRFTFLLFTLPLLWLVLNIVLRAGGTQVWDDAFMFWRYASHWHSEGVWCWNLGEGPVFGMTSPAWAMVVTAAQPMVEQPALLLWVCSLLTGFAFAGVMAAMVWRFVPVNEQRSAWLLLAVSAGGAGTQLAVHFTSGMDTALSLLAVSVFIYFCLAWEAAPTVSRSLLTGIAGGALWLVRPELVLAGLLAPAVAFLRGNARMYALLWLSTTVLMLGGVAALLMHTFHSVVPLSFYAKSGSVYGPDFAAIYRWVPFLQAVAFGVATFPALALIRRATRLRGWNSFSPVEQGLAVAAFISFFYYLLAVTQVMPFHARFYFPFYPLWLWLGVKSLRLASFQWSSSGWVTLSLLLALMGSGWLLHGRPEGLRSAWGRWSLSEVYEAQGRRTWPALSVIQSLPEDVVIATTEVGLPGAWCPGKKIIDLAGLNQPDLSGKPFDATTFFARYRPDVIFAPHPHYRDMLRAMESDSVFRAEYEYFPSEKTGTILGVAILRKSPNFETLRQSLNLPLGLQ